MREQFRKYKGFIFDMDGTVYLEEKMIIGAVETLNLLINAGKHVLFVTNKTTHSQNDYAKFLIDNGVKVTSEQIITAADNCIEYLKKKKTNRNFYAIAEESFINSVVESGLKYTEETKIIDIVIVTLDRNYTQQKYEIAKEALNNGAQFFAANIDNTCPVLKGEIVDAGIVISNLEEATNIKLQKHFGKPSEYMISTIERKLKFEKKNYLLVGDRIETDILMGNKMGIDTALVNSGVENKIGMLDVNFQFSLSSIREILN